MRPYIDLNNLSYSKQTLIYYSRGKILSSVFMFLLGCVGMVYPLIKQDYEMILFCSILFVFYFGYKAYDQYLVIDQVQLKLNSEGIQYRNEALISWDFIENISFYSIQKNDDSIDYFKYYCTNIDKIMVFEINELDIFRLDLEMSVRIHKNRFELAKNNTPAVF